MCGTLMESLEPRVCLAAAEFAGVGYAYMASDWDGYLLDDISARYDGEVDTATGTAWYDVWLAGGGGERPGPFGRQVIRNFTALNDGRITGVHETTAFDPSFGYPTDTAGTNFLYSDGYPVGWSASEWAGPGLQGETRVFQMFVEKPTRASLPSLAGTWDFTALYSSWSLDLLAGGTGQFTVSGSNISGQVTLEGGFVFPVNERILQVSSDGLVRLATGNSLQLGADGNVMLFGLMDLNEVFGIGVAFRRDSSPVASDLLGTYRLGSLWSGDPAFLLNGTAAAIGTDVLELDADRTFQIYNTLEYDLGSRLPVATGYWTVQRDRVVLSSGGESIEMLSAHDGHALYITNYAGSPVLSIGVKVVPPGGDSQDDDDDSGSDDEPSVNAHVNPGTAVVGASVNGLLRVVSRNIEGRTIVLTEANSGEWSAVDIANETGSTTPAADAVAWTDPKDQLLYVAASSDHGLLLYRQSANGDWTFRNLSQEAEGSLQTAAEITVFTSKGGVVHLAGLDSAGDLLLFKQTGGLVGQEFAWTGRNLSVTDLEPRGLSTPVFEGNLVSFVTAWDALNLVGLDATGDIQAIWIAGTMQNWTASNLSSITGAPPLTGGLSVYLTPWQGINLAGTDASGGVSVTWWVPSFGGDWRTSNLTDLFGGPRLIASSVTSWVTAWGGLNVAGIDLDGQIVAYWWAPGMKERFGSDRWKIADISSQFNALPYSPSGRLQGVSVAENSSMNILTTSVDHKLLRYWWTPEDRWQLESLSDVI